MKSIGRTVQHLYHYTKWRALCEIIKSDSFLFSEFTKANDYKEKACKLKDEIEKYKYISFTYSDELELYSYTNPPLWYYYAEKGHGVCIRFDKVKLLNKVKAIKSDFINYRNGVTHVDDQTIEEYLMEKRKAWQYENEYRILVSAEQNCIKNILDCMAAIYMGPEVAEEDIQSIYEHIPESVDIFKVYIDKTDGRFHCIDYRNKLSLKERQE